MFPNRYRIPLAVNGMDDCKILFNLMHLGLHYSPVPARFNLSFILMGVVFSWTHMWTQVWTESIDAFSPLWKSKRPWGRARIPASGGILTLSAYSCFINWWSEDLPKIWTFKNLGWQWHHQVLPPFQLMLASNIFKNCIWTSDEIKITY